LLSKDGASFRSQLELTVIRWSGGKRRCHVVISDISERKRYDARFVAQQITPAMLESGIIGMMTFSGDGRCQSINQMMALMLGSTPEQLLTQNVRQLESWRHSGLLSAVDEALGETSERQLEVQLVSFTGQTVCLSCKIIPYQQTDQWLVLLLATTGSMGPSMALPAEVITGNFGGIFNVEEDVDFQCDLDGRILSINRSLWYMTGYSNEEILGHNIRELAISPSRWAEFLGCLQREGSIKNWQISMNAKDKRPVQLSLQALLIRDKQGQPLCIEGTCHMRSERRHAARGKLVFADLLYTFIETMTEAVTFCDARGQVWICNAAMTQLTGYTREEANACDNFIHLLFPDTETRAWAFQQFAELRANGTAEQVETTIVTRSGERKDILVSARFLQHNHQQMFITVFRDITTLKHTEAESLRKQHALRALTSQVISAEMHERQRLATVLHDNIGQLLAVARLRVDMQEADAQTEQVAGDWHEMGSLLQQIIAESRTMTFELFPPPLYESGIADAMRWLTRALSESTGIHMTFTTNVDFDHQHVTIRDFVFWSAR